MGAWGLGNFDNDDALDWLANLEKSKDSQLLQTAFDDVIADEDREAPDCCIALAAGEVVAALKGKPAENLPEQVTAWVSGFAGNLDTVVVDRAIEAIDHILVESELKELWEETDEYQAWVSIVSGLTNRLGK